MSKLEELINKLCPDGVEYFKIDDLRKLKFFIVVTPSFKVKSNQYMEQGLTPIVSQEIDLISGYCDHVDDRIPEAQYVCFGDHSEHIKFVDFSFVQGADGLKILLTDNQNLLARFFYYATSSCYIRHNNYERHYKYFIDTQIPLPPLPVQEEIVRILDNMTSLTAELTAELKARQKQYEYYRDSLLSFDEDNAKDGVRWMKLQDIADIGTGSSNTNEELEEGLYPFFVRSQQVRRKNTYEFDETAIITSGDGVGVGKIFHYVEGKYALHQRAYRIHINTPDVFPKYFFYFMKTTFLSYIEKNSFHSSVTSIRRPMLNNYLVPIPPLEEQQRIVDILDRFDKLCNDISEGLPAEIEARKKQYEYYRDKLLTFKEKEA